MALVQNIKAWSHRINKCTFYSLSLMPYVEHLFSWFIVRERNSTGLTYIFTYNIVMLISYNFMYPKPIFRIWLIKYTMLFGLWTLMVGTHTSDWYIHITLHCFEVLSKLLLIWNYFKVSWSVDLPEGLPTDIPLCISGLISLKNLCEDPFLYLKNVFSAPAKHCMHIVLVIVTSKTWVGLPGSLFDLLYYTL